MKHIIKIFVGLCLFASTALFAYISVKDITTCSSFFAFLSVCGVLITAEYIARKMKD